MIAHGLDFHKVNQGLGTNNFDYILFFAPNWTSMAIFQVNQESAYFKMEVAEACTIIDTEDNSQTAFVFKLIKQLKLKFLI